MKNLTKIFVSGTLALAMVLASVTNINAKECSSVYGGGEVCETGDITIDKKVWNPQKNEYWDTIDSSVYMFSPNDEVKFELKIKNISDVELDNVITRDILPDYLIYQSSNNDGKFYDSRTVEWNRNDLNDDQTETYSVVVKIKDANNVPSGITCLTNKGEVYGKDDDISDTDTAMFCIKNGEGEKKVLGVSYPETGPFGVIPMTLEVMGFGVLGLAYIVKAKKIKKLI